MATSLADASFRRRPKKNPISDPNAITLDSKHQEKLNYFQQLQDSLPERRAELQKLKEEYSHLSNKTPKNDSINYYKRKHELPKEIKQLEQDISDIVFRKEEIDYYAQTHSILVEYYSKCDPTVPNSKKTKKKRPKKGGTFDELLNVDKTTNKGELLDSYLSATDRSYTSKHIESDNIWQCKSCESCDLVSIPKEAIIVCEDCGMINNDLPIDIDYTPSFKEMQDIDRQPAFAYKKINHFNEHLQNMQAEENTQIPDTVVQAVRLEMQKEKIRPEKLNEKKVRGYLKKHGLNKYYEHIYHIICLMNGNPPLKMEISLRNQLCTMFHEIQAPFTKHCPPERKNFLSYKYVLHKFCQLLSRDEYLKYFPLLKSREKLYQQDLIWKGICDDLEWEFIPSV